MSVTKRKTYFSAPTCKQINAILNKGWKLISINSTLCTEGDIVSVGESKRYSFSFEKCDNGEEYCCLQYFLLPALFSEEGYGRIVEEIEGYQKQGAYIISAWHIKKDKTVSLRSDLLGDASLNDGIRFNMEDFFEGEKGLLYYIIVPMDRVKEQNEERSYDAMLKFLGFKVYVNIDSWWLIIFIFFILNIGELFLWGIGSLYILQFVITGVLFFYLCYNIPNYYYFFRYRLYRKEYSVRNFLKKQKCSRENV